MACLTLGSQLSATYPPFVSGNQADGNGRDGIRDRGTSSGNTFDGNHMSGNAEHDAHDENRAANTWTGNHCVTDFPAGTICGQ